MKSKINSAKLKIFFKKRVNFNKNGLFFVKKSVNTKL